MHPLGEKRVLQAVVTVAAIVPVAAGLDGALRGVAMVGGGGTSLDSHFSYLSGLLLGLGLLFWSVVPHIERRTALVRALTLMVVVGGLARACSLYRVGPPGTAMRLALVMELGVTPALCLWQGRVARRAAGDSPPVT
jgi:hypothetical protein